MRWLCTLAIAAISAEAAAAVERLPQFPQADCSLRVSEALKRLTQHSEAQRVFHRYHPSMEERLCFYGRSMTQILHHCPETPARRAVEAVLQTLASLYPLRQADSSAPFADCERLRFARASTPQPPAVPVQTHLHRHVHSSEAAAVAEDNCSSLLLGFVVLALSTAVLAVLSGLLLCRLQRFHYATDGHKVYVPNQRKEPPPPGVATMAWHPIMRSKGYATLPEGEAI